MPALHDPIIDRFLDALWLEKGLADNTRDAYCSDLALFNGWLAERGASLVGAGRDAILDHLAWRLANGYKARSNVFFTDTLKTSVNKEFPSLKFDMSNFLVCQPNLFQMRVSM